MPIQSSCYTETQIADLAALDAALIQARIDTLKDESFVRIQTLRDAHRSSEIRADTEMKWRQARADALNETVIAAVRDEAEARRLNYEKMEGAKNYWEDGIGEARKAAVEREGELRSKIMRDEGELRLKIMRDESELKLKIMKPEGEGRS